VIPLELAAEVTAADARRYRWDSNRPAGDRIRNLSFSTKIGEGFSSAQGQLARRIDMDYPDLSLVDNVTIFGMDGSVAWEGRISAMPRELSDTHSIGVTCTGWMSHAKDKKLSEIYVDRDQSGWGDMSAARRANRLTNNFTFLNAPAQQADPSTNVAQVSTNFTGAWASPYKPYAEAWYDAGPDARIGKIVYSWKREGLVTIPDANWSWQVGLSTDAK